MLLVIFLMKTLKFNNFFMSAFLKRSKILMILVAFEAQSLTVS